MEPIIVGALAFAFMFGAALAGMRLRRALPEKHFSAESKDTVKVAIGLVATMTALVLGLVTASAKSSFDAVDRTAKDAAADLLTLDRTLARYGPESQGVRDALQQLVAQRLEQIWSSRAGSDVPDATVAERLVERIGSLSPQNERQRRLQSRALEQGEALLEMRWVVSSRVGSAVPLPFLTVLVIWLGITFASFGLFATPNGTVIAGFLLATLSVAAAIFLILEMDDPFHGIVTISQDPLRYAYSRINH